MMTSNFFVGAFLKYKYHLVDEIQTIVGCSNVSCKNYGKDIHFGKFTFCPFCGNKISSLNISKHIPSVDTFDFTETINEVLIQVDLDKSSYHYYIDNTTKGLKTAIHITDNADKFIETLRITEWESNFETKFSTEIETAKKLYDSVEIETGVLAWMDWNLDYFSVF